MTLNINYNIKAKLNDYGVEILKARHRQLVESSQGAYNQPFTLPSTDENGYSIFQFWTFMQIFGPHLHLGSEMPFEADIIISDRKDLHENI